MKLSIVTTLYKSAPFIHEFVDRTCKAAEELVGEDYEIILVNDGSPDESLAIAVKLTQEYFGLTIVDLSRNFGHHKAIKTGLSFAEGKYIFLIDSDLEEAPELLVLYWNELIKCSCDVVYGVQRDRKGKWFERVSGRLFYKLLNFLISMEYPVDTLTARLMTKRYVQAVLSFKEREIDIWGIFVLAGYSQKAIISKKLGKKTSTYSLSRKIRMAIDTITTISFVPLYLSFIFGFVYLTLSLLGILYIIFMKYLYGITEGWASIIVLILFSGGIILFVLGILSIYLSKIYLEVKSRPLSIVRQVYLSKNAKKIY